MRQGCPLSGLLFVVGIELLARVLKKDHTIKGIQVGQKEIKITQYADDTTVLVRDLDSVTQLLKHLDKFKQISGLEINTNKTEVLWLEYWRSRKDKPFGFKWPQEPVYALGIHFSYDLKQANTLNFEETLCSLGKQKTKTLITYGVYSSFLTCFSNWWQEKFNQKLILSESTILYSWHKESDNWKVLNYILFDCRQI